MLLFGLVIEAPRCCRAEEAPLVLLGRRAFFGLENVAREDTQHVRVVRGAGLTCFGTSDRSGAAAIMTVSICAVISVGCPPGAAGNPPGDPQEPTDFCCRVWPPLGGW